MDKFQTVMDEHSVLVVQSTVSLSINPFGRETERFLEWVIEDALLLGHGDPNFDASDVIRHEVEKGLEGTGVRLSEWCVYSDLVYTFELPLNACAGDEIKRLEILVFDCVKQSIKHYQLEAFWPLYNEYTNRVNVYRNEKGILDLTDVNSNIYKIHAQLGRVFTYLAQRLARKFVPRPTL